jgi:hypothetical protein
MRLLLVLLALTAARVTPVARAQANEPGSPTSAGQGPGQGSHTTPDKPAGRLGDPVLDNSDFKIALPVHAGRLEWHAENYKPVELSAKPQGEEIGIRATKASGKRTFLGILFLVPEEAPLTSAKCRDGSLEEDRGSVASFTQVASVEMPRAKGPALDLVTYKVANKVGKTTYIVRGFVAAGELCGDLEIYSDDAIDAKDPEIAKTFASLQLDPAHAPSETDIAFYAQILFQHQSFSAAAPLFEKALAKVPAGDANRDTRRVLTDQTGMAYGIAGNLPKSRAMFTAAIAKDPDYPLYYYNLACADAAEKKLADAKTHLEQAFARKANMIKGEEMPDPSKDDSFTPYKGDKDFWAFVTSLR